MEDATDPRAYGLTVLLLRKVHGGTQRELAEAAGVDPGSLADYETFKHRPRPSTLAKLARATGVGLAFVDEHLALADRILKSRGGPAEEVPGQGLEAAAAHPALARLLAASSGLSAEGRARAGELLDALRGLSREDREWLLAWNPEARTPALLDRLCEESVRAAPGDPGEALAWAELAVFLAPRLPAEPRQGRRLEAHARAFVGNARRAAGDLRGAERELRRSRELWEEGAGAGPFPLDASRRLDLEASLRRGQRRFAEAHALLAEALGAATAGDSAGRLLLNKAFAFEQEGEPERALEALRLASAEVDGLTDPRLPCVARYNRAAALARLGRFAEADPLLPEVRRLAEGLDLGIDLLRLFWLEGCVAGGLGRHEEALAALERVRREFAERRIAYDAALVSLDLAALRLERGEAAEVRRLAEEMLWIFEAQGIAREALAALRLFFEAARQQQATADMARRAAEALKRELQGQGKVAL
jgi:transcriptional regulator with XRE-family HTH domain